MEALRRDFDGYSSVNSTWDRKYMPLEMSPTDNCSDEIPDVGNETDGVMNFVPASTVSMHA